MKYGVAFHSLGAPLVGTGPLAAMRVSRRRAQVKSSQQMALLFPNRGRQVSNANAILAEFAVRSSTRQKALLGDGGPLVEIVF